MRAWCSKFFSSTTDNASSLQTKLLTTVPLNDVKSMPVAAPTKADAEDMKRIINSIQAQIESERKRLQIIEDNKSRCQKKSFWAKFVAPTAMLIPATYKLVKASLNKTTAEKQIVKDLVPTCNPNSDPMWPNSVGTPGIYNIINICSDNVYYDSPAERLKECIYWSSPNTGKPAFECDFNICVSICDFSRAEVGNNNWTGGWLVFGAAASIAAGWCLSGLFVTLDEVPLAKASKTLFTEGTFLLTDSEKIRLWLNKDEQSFAKMTMGQVKNELEKKLNSARTSQLRSSYHSTDDNHVDGNSLSTDSELPTRSASPA